MARKQLVTISEDKSINQEAKVFDISFARRMLAFSIFGAFDLREFNRRGYLVELINRFKQEGKACFILFSSFGGVRGAAEVSVDKALGLTDSYLALEPITPDNWSDKIFFSYPNMIYLLILRAEISEVKNIFTWIDSMDTRCYFIFEDESKKADLFAKVRQLHKKKTLEDANIISLGAEAIILRFGKYSAEETFKVITRRFDQKQVKELLSDTLKKDKFEVR
ncbi:MAG: hypothetical protein ISS27_02375 [Candidatus Omnitrophica bacterium]|nr:hypothetical protein [Candidatus Omnitrophota bacterium]